MRRITLLVVFFMLGCGSDPDPDGGLLDATTSDGGPADSGAPDGGLDAGSDAAVDAGPCGSAENDVASTCGDLDLARFGRACGSDTETCSRCVADSLSGDSCGALPTTCTSCFCPVPPPPVVFEDGGVPDAGPDSGAADGGLDGGVGDGGVAVCGESGRMGGACRSGTTCATGLTCVAEFTTLPMFGLPVTLGNLFSISSGTPDPDRPGEYLAGAPSGVPLRFAPGGGLCTQLCDPAAADDACGPCGRCSSRLGGAPAFAEIGITATTFAQRDSDDPTGVCRLRCTFDAETNGGCPTDYTCDAGEQVCVEACTTDSQCNLAWGSSREAGLVAIQRSGALQCDLTLGRCVPTDDGPRGTDGDRCDGSEDCAEHTGECVAGRCVTQACDAGFVCGGCATCSQGSCAELCDAAEDCWPGQACVADASAVGAAGYCRPDCDDDDSCRGGQRCAPLGFPAVRHSMCRAYCDADLSDGSDPGATACGADHGCVPVQDGWGVCEPLGRLCSRDAHCSVTQACEVLEDDSAGRCVDGCETDADCGSERCRIQEGAVVGVCRASGAACSPSTIGADAQPTQPLRGDAQCSPGETCSTSEPEASGTCG